MRTVSVTMRDEVLEAAKKNAQLAGMSVDQFLAKVIEQAVSLPGKRKSRSQRIRAGEEALLSEAVLAKDWLRPEEDQAWANL